MAAKRFESKEVLDNLPNLPGVYRMIGADSVVLYVGKAKDLKKRVTSYFRTQLDVKTQSLVSRIESVEFTVTASEAEALLLENNLIKNLKPRYNILLRDDKSYPYIFLSDDEYPRFSFYRGAKKAKGRYFGPYASAGAVRETLQILQKLFPVRQCENSFYNNRSRPCLQYQLKRCTAPCVGLVAQVDYLQDVEHAVMFLQGKSEQLTNHLEQKMQQASEDLAYETAAHYRDQISALRRVQQKQAVSVESGNCDVIAAVVHGGACCVLVFKIRNGLNLGNKNYFPKLGTEKNSAEVLASFLPWMYLDKSIPDEIIVNTDFDDRELLQQVFSEQTGRNIRIAYRVKGARGKWLNMAQANGETSLANYLASRLNVLQRFEALQNELQLAETPKRIECFDVSHSMGEKTYASCVAFDINGPLKSDYRRYKIANITPGDDYQAMLQALTRRFRHANDENAVIPDILLIDGGKGQLAQAENVLQELNLSGVVLIGVAKGVERKPGKETLFLSRTGPAFILPSDSQALHLIQQIRDEAHRFAITGHRHSRDKSRRRSVLEDIPGVGAKRRRALLQYFGGIQGLGRASKEDIEKVPGISRQLAEKIYETIRNT